MFLCVKELLGGKHDSSFAQYLVKFKNNKANDYPSEFNFSFKDKNGQLLSYNFVELENLTNAFVFLPNGQGGVQLFDQQAVSTINVLFLFK